MPLARVAVLLVLTVLPGAQAAFSQAHDEQAYQARTVTTDTGNATLTVSRLFVLDHDESTYVWIDRATLDVAQTYNLSLDVHVGTANQAGGMGSEIYSAFNVSDTRPIGLKLAPGNTSNLLQLVVHLPPVGSRVVANFTVRALLALDEDVAGSGSGGTYDPTIATTFAITVESPRPVASNMSGNASSNNASAETPGNATPGSDSPQTCAACPASSPPFDAGADLNPLAASDFPSNSSSPTQGQAHRATPDRQGAWQAVLWLAAAAAAALLLRYVLRLRRRAGDQAGSGIGPPPDDGPWTQPMPEDEEYPNDPGPPLDGTESGEPEEGLRGLSSREDAPVGPGGVANLRLR